MTERQKKLLLWGKETGFVILCIFAATGVGQIFQMAGFPETNIVIIYLLAVVAATRFSSGYFAGMLASVGAMLAFNYFFTEPFYTLKINDYSYIITFVVMTCASLMTSTLTAKVQRSAKEANEKAKEAHILYDLTNHLSDAKDMEEIAKISICSIYDMMQVPVAMLCFDENGEPENSFLQYTENGMIHRDFYPADEVAHRVQGLRGGYVKGEEFYEWPVYGHEMILGVLRIPVTEEEEILEGQKKTILSMLECIALAMDRLKTAQKQRKTQEEKKQEHYRSNLLRAISHDLRTPLSGIMGTSEVIKDMCKDGDIRKGLAQNIWDEADWLHGLVENILNLTRLEDGRLAIKKQPEAVEEILESALVHIEKRAPEAMIELEIPDDLLLIPMDAKLMVQVLVNLLDNAVKYTETDKAITIRVWKEGTKACFCVSDEGKGIAEEDLPHIFQTFYTSKYRRADAHRSTGLGLAICEAIVRAHGGSIEAANRPEGGAEFYFTLPMEGDR